MMDKPKTFGLDLKATAEEWKSFQDNFAPAMALLFERTGYRARFRFADGVISIDISPL